MDDELTYQIKLTLEEWQFWQRYRQIRKTYHDGMIILAWAERLTWRVVGKEEPNRIVE